jgi:hypothetical protein
MLLLSDNALTGVPGTFNTPFSLCSRVSFIHSMGFARLAEDTIRKIRGKGEKDSLGAMDKILASSIGGALATWNQPIEVIRVEVSNTLSPVLSLC